MIFPETFSEDIVTRILKGIIAITFQFLDYFWWWIKFNSFSLFLKSVGSHKSATDMYTSCWVIKPPVVTHDREMLKIIFISLRLINLFPFQIICLKFLTFWLCGYVWGFLLFDLYTHCYILLKSQFKIENCFAISE